MKLFFPDNIYSKLLADHLPEILKQNISVIPSSAIPSELRKDSSSAGLITPTDILSAEDLFISSKMGISFEGILSNSYLYFYPGQKDFDTVSLYGDISSLEVILSKLFFKENYNTEVQVEILTDIKNTEGKNLLVTGKTNFSSFRYNDGISFAEEMTDMLSLPYVNFILASFDRKIIEDLNLTCSGIGSKVYDSVEKNLFSDDLALELREYIRENIASLVYDLEEQDIDGIHQLIRLPYFYGLVDNIAEPKLV